MKLTKSPEFQNLFKPCSPEGSGSEEHELEAHGIWSYQMGLNSNSVPTESQLPPLEKEDNNTCFPR